MQTVTFAELGLSAKVQAAVDAAGYTIPTPIQAQAIPVAVTGRDVLGIAQTGTGKTASFVLPMLCRLETGRARARMPRSLILAPTRELAAQVAQSFEKYGTNHRLNVALLIGGVSFDDQLRKLDRGADVLIATPGRLLDHFQRGKILMTGVEILVIDEADRMLDMGFIPDIEKICKLLPPRRQTLFFSATMPPEIQRLVASFLNDPLRIEVARPATTAGTITQRFRFCPSGEDWAKREVLRDLIRSENVKNAIIFCNRKRDVAILLKSLMKHGFNAGALHGDMDQSSRMATLDAFRDGRIALLAASDVAARGLDIPDVSHVFNYDVPWASDDYVHRIGRTGRAGKEGASFTLVTPEDAKALRDIEKMLGAPAAWIGEPPTEEDLAHSGKRRRRGKSEERGRGADARRGSGRDRERDRDRRPRRQDGEGDREQPPQSAMDAPQPQQRAERAQADRPQGDRPPRRERSHGDRPRARQERPDAEPRERPPRRERHAERPRRDEPRDQPTRQESRPENTRGGGSAPVGLGDHVPAFLKRAVRLAPR
ncbi:MAG: DEAD/DEAH box helicase [Hyphomicrobiaceae bacterium]|nr:DEAD/DEAH box helicase [Hyphomicrobiaceae bacterium]